MVQGMDNSQEKEYKWLLSIWNDAYLIEWETQTMVLYHVSSVSLAKIK